MIDYPLDIIIPVWNSPVEVRAALASFANASPLARLVMVNNGSERETEAVLHEFAEALDDRALLLSTGRNIGMVAALNLGILRSAAPYILVTNPFVRMTSGWFDLVLSVFSQIHDVGAVCLRSRQGAIGEADHGSFSAMIMKRELYQCATGFDEQMDGAVWALRDFARRATAHGYKTYSIYCGQLKHEKQQEFGSLARREQRVSAAKKIYVERWGESQVYLLNCTDSIPGDRAVFREVLLAAARQGDRITVTVASKLGKLLVQEGFGVMHENISLLVLPRFFPGRALRRAIDRITTADAATQLVIIEDAIDCPLDRLPFADFLARLQWRTETFYQGGAYA